MNTDTESTERLVQRRLVSLPSETRPPLDWPAMAALLEQRRGQAASVRRVSPHRVLGSRAAAAVSGMGVGVLVMMALVLRGEQPHLASDRASGVASPTAPTHAAVAPTMDPGTRALVYAGPLAATHALEDSIALIDEVLTEERVRGVRGERLHALEARRTQLVGSLQQVQLAERLMYE